MLFFADVFSKKKFAAANSSHQSTFFKIPHHSKWIHIYTPPPNRTDLSPSGECVAGGAIWPPPAQLLALVCW